MNTEELKPCPFCGSCGIDKDDYWHRNSCTNCGSRGPAAGNSPNAQWNTRTDLSDTQAARIAEYEVRLRELEAENRELAMQCIASDGQAQMAYEEQIRLEAKLAKAEDGLRECEQEIDGYIWQEYPSDHPVHERYRQRDFDANPARATLAELKEQNSE